MTKKSATIIPFATAYSPKQRVPFETTGPSLTNGEFAEELKVQNMIKKFDQDNYFELTKRVATYSDFTNTTNLTDAMSQIESAQNSFQEFPAEIRERFRNDPRVFYDFVLDEKNQKELQELGLMKRPRIESSPSEDDKSYPSEEDYTSSEG